MDFPGMPSEQRQVNRGGASAVWERLCSEERSDEEP